MYDSVADVPNAVDVCAASLARKVYMRQKLGVGGLRKHYGGKNKRKVCVGASQRPTAELAGEDRSSCKQPSPC